MSGQPIHTDVSNAIVSPLEMDLHLPDINRS